MKAAVMTVVGGYFRPEFINRLDEVVVFHPLAREQIQGIAKIQLAQLHRRLTEQELGLSISDAVLDKLCAAGFDPVYGARPLKRAIQRELENPLASALLRGDFSRGDHIQADLIDAQVVFKPLKPSTH